MTRKYVIHKVKKDTVGRVVAVKTGYEEFTVQQVVLMIEHNIAEFYAITEYEDELPVKVFHHNHKKLLKVFKDGEPTNILEGLSSY